jgi:heptosyltransferase-2
MKALIFLPNWIGDAVMATPSLRAMRRQLGPQATLVGVMRPAVADLLAGTRWLDEAVLYAPRSRAAELRSLRVLARLRRERFDLAVLLPNSFRAALLALLAGARRRVGYARYGRGPLLTRALTPARREGRLVPGPMVDYYLALAAAIGCPPESPQLELATTPDDERAAEVVWSKHGLGDRGVVVLNSSGAFGAAKLWPVEYFAQLARRIVVEAGLDVLVLCGPSEREIAAEIVRLAAHPRVVSLAGEPLSIGLSKACVRRARLLVSTDSGPRHFAVAFGVPVVGVYGPTPPVWGANPTARAVDLHLDLDCLGCHQRTCPLGHHRCMRDLSVERVWRAVAQQLAEPQRRAAA